MGTVKGGKRIVNEEKISTNELHKYTLEQVLRKLEEKVNITVKQEIFPEELYGIIKEFGEREWLTNYLIVKMFLERYIKEGMVELLGRKELEELLPWGKTILSERLQKFVKEELLHYTKRKYSLNLENPFVLRVKDSMRVEYGEYDLEKLLREFVLERKGEKRIEKPMQEKEYYRELTEGEMRAFVYSIIQIVSQPSQFNQEEELQEFLKRNILKTIGIARVRD